MFFRSVPWKPVYAQIDLKNCILRIKDGGSTPNTLIVKMGEGNFTYSERKNREYAKNRGLLDLVRDGDEEPVEVKFDGVWEYIRDETGGTATIEDALKQRGAASDWVSTDADACQPYAVDLELDNTPNCVDVDKEILTFADFRWEQVDHDLRAGTISVTGHCNVVEPTSVRSSLSV